MTIKLLRTSQTSLKTRLISTCTQISANKKGRQLALPIAFLSVKGWGETSVEDTWLKWAKSFSNRGYSSLLIEIDPEELDPTPIDSKSLLDQLETKLTTILKNSDSPFPPLLISAYTSTLLSETYVSSHPLSGLLLYSPIKTNSAHQLLPKIFKSSIPEFDYEPHFHLAVMDSNENSFTDNRLLENYGELEDKGKVVGLVGKIDEEGWEIVMDWADQL